MLEFQVDPLPSPISPAELYFDLGTHTFPVSTKSRYAQAWFDRGLIWSYAFNHEEGFRCFKQALAHDPTCAMAYWGMSYAAGPNYNKPWQMFDPSDLLNSFKVCYYTSRKAEELANRQNAKPVERGIIKAFQALYPEDNPGSDFSSLDKSYAAAMEKVFHEFGKTENLDVTTLYVDALMHTALRGMYAVQTGAPIESSPVHKVRAIFDTALATRASDNHPGIFHFWVHFMEMSNIPGIALPAADRLRHLVPDGGHMHHMPTLPPFNRV